MILAQLPHANVGDFTVNGVHVSPTVVEAHCDNAQRLRHYLALKLLPLSVGPAPTRRLNQRLESA